jgi:DNA polymerase elongation subunit (family B)
MGAKECKIEFELNKVYKNLLFVAAGSGKGAKKKYVGWMCYKDGKPKDQLDYAGVAMKRKDTPVIIKDIMETFYSKLMQGEEKEKVISYLKNQIKTLKTKKSHEISPVIQLGKDVEEYAPGVQHIRGINHAKEKLNKGFMRMDYIRIIYLKGRSDVICIAVDETLPEEYESKFDHNRTIDKVLISNIRPVFKMLNWNIDVLGGQTLLSMFENGNQ